MENCVLRGRNQSLASEVQTRSSALHAAQSSTPFVHSQAQAHVASLSHKWQSAVDEVESLNSRINLMKSLHNSEIQDQQRLMHDSHIAFHRYVGDSQEMITRLQSETGSQSQAFSP